MALDIPSGLSPHPQARQAISSAISGGWLKKIFNELRKAKADVGKS